KSPKVKFVYNGLRKNEGLSSIKELEWILRINMTVNIGHGLLE
ncbi:2418_t:CDS:1, partial [Dentiscutata heterogama]